VSLYREAGRGTTRTLLIAGGIALVVGMLVGFALGRASAPEPSAADVVSDLRADLRPVAGGIELLPNEYAQAFRNEGAEAEGVRGALERIDKQLAKARPDLQTLDPDGMKALDDAFAQLESAVQQKAPPSEVSERAQEVATALKAVPGGN
jgi:hypothetical protein